MQRILLVDDESIVLTVLGNLFRSDGYDVIPIQDGREAVKLLKSEEKIDLMISDIRMKPIDGMKLLKLAAEVRPSMPVVMVTAYGSNATEKEAKKAGALAYMTKPFKTEELLATVKQALEHKDQDLT